MAARSIWDPARQQEIRGRLARVSAESRPLWGKMNAAEMMFHLDASLRMANGELRCAERPGPLRLRPLRYLVVYWLPIPKGVPTAPELLSAVAPSEFAASQASALAGFDRFAAAGAQQRLVPHPAFGDLSNADWGALIYKHMDHHLRQFGV